MFDFNKYSYRTARGIRVVPYNRVDTLNIDESIVCAYDTNNNSDAYGIAVNQKISTNAIEVDQATALLLLTMKQSGKLPDYLLHELENDDGLQTQRGITDLILNNLLEIKIGHRFKSGTAAIASICQHNEIHSSTVDDDNSMRDITHEALRHIDLLGLTDQGEIFNKLYQYNLIPANASKRRQLENDVEFLQLNKVSTYWRLNRNIEAWYYFNPPTHIQTNSTVKLYISPTPDTLAKTLQIVASILKDFENTSFKVGKGSVGILRPDKLVAYFDSMETLLAAAQKLQSALVGTPSHCVPFTSMYSRDGLLSWGIDPAETDGERKSWRQWLIEQIAEYIAASPASPQRWHTALARLELDGINPNTFRPGGTWITEHT